MQWVLENHHFLIIFTRFCGYLGHKRGNTTKWKYYIMVCPGASPPSSVCSEVLLMADSLKLAMMGVFTPGKIGRHYKSKELFFVVL